MAKKKELKKLLAQARAELREVVMNPDSQDSKCIKARVKYSATIEEPKGKAPWWLKQVALCSIDSIQPE